MSATSEFETYYRTNYVRVLNYVERRLADSEVAREICAECFVIAWRKFDPDDPFPLVWLFQTARNLIGNAYRKRRSEQQLLVLLHQEAEVDRSAPEAAIVAEALRGLGEKDREALRLTYWECLTAVEVAAVLGCSEQAAWKRISRAKAALRKVMESVAADEEGVR